MPWALCCQDAVESEGSDMTTTSAEAGARRDKTDRQLLDRFVACGDQAAFAELVARHGACVWAVCRRVLGQVQDAEDAFQAVFLILGRKAVAIRKRESVGSWLHGVAYRAAMKLRRAAARRRARERHAGSAAPEPPPPDQAAARELQRLLDEEVARLAEKYRTPFVLCCLEGRTRPEAAHQLGWSEGTVSSRLAQARALLQKRLGQRGFTFSAVLTACALAEGKVAAAAPLALVQCAVQAGVAGNVAAAFSPSVVTLADGIGRALMVTRLKTAVVVSLSLALVTSAAGVAAHQMLPARAEGPAAVQEKPAPPGALPAVSDVWSAVLSPDGRLAAAGAGRWDQPGEVGVWDLATGKPLLHVAERKGVASVAFSPDGKLLAWGNNSNEVRLAEVPSGNEVAVLRTPRVSRVAFSPDGSLLAVASEAGIVRLVDVARRKTLCDLEGDLFRFHHVAFSPDGKRLLAGGGDWRQGGVCQVTVWDVDSRKQVGKLIGHEFAVLCIAFSPDGKTIATGAVDRTIRLWDADTGAEIKVLRGHGDRVECLTFTRDGKTLVSGGLDGTVRFWDVAEGRETARLGGPPGEDAAAANGVAAAAWGFTRSVRAVRFTPDGSTLLVGGGPRTLRLFDSATRKETAVLWESPPPEAQPPAAAPPPGQAADAPERKPNDGGPANGEPKAAPQPAPPPREWPEHVDIQFNKGLDAHRELSWFGPSAAAVTRVEPQGLRFTLPAGREDVGEVGVAAQKTLRGDFEITLAYELLAVPVPGPQWGAGAVLEADFDTPDSPKVRLTRTQKAGGATFGSTYYALDSDGKKTGYPLQYPRANEEVRTGRLRLVRTGKALAFQVDEGGAGFRTIATKEVGGADVVSVRAMVTTGAKPLPVDLRYSNLELRWAPDTRIAPPPGASSPRTRGWLSAAVALVVLIGLSMAGVLLVVRHRRRADKGQPLEASPTTNAPGVPPQAPIAFPCPACRRMLKVKAEQAGKKGKCPHCTAAVEVPSPRAGSPDAPGRTTA
jgi:RNA polymerase sigma factor (sigma-70 family)